MAPSDTREPFTRIPWIARHLNKPNIVTRVPSCRNPKSSTEDSLMAEILKTPRTLRSCISFYKKLSAEEDHIPEIWTVVTLGNGMNGHPHTLHGGIIATLLDESIGIYQNINIERTHLLKVQQGFAEGEIPETQPSYTAELKVTYKRPVQTPGAVLVRAWRVKREGRKEWMNAEVRQVQEVGEGEEGEEVVCARGEGLFVEPRREKL